MSPQHLALPGFCFPRSLAGRILTLLYTNEYSGNGRSFDHPLCAGSALSYIASFLGYGMTALRRFSIQVPIFVAVVLITLISCYFLTERYGLMGTAVGILLGNLGQLLMSAAVVWRTAQRDRKRSLSDSCAIVEIVGSTS